MNLDNTQKQLRNNLNSISTLIDAGDYHSAAQQLSVLQTSDADCNEQQKTIDYFRLMVYNRLQWLVEASHVVSRLASYKNLGSDDFLEIALFYVLTAKLAPAEEYMKKALSQNKKSALLASELAILYEQQGKSSKALAIYDQIFSRAIKRKVMDSVSVRILNRLTGLRALNDDETKKISALCSKYQNEEREVRLLFGLARSYAKQGDINREIECLEKANRLADVINESQIPSHNIENSRDRLAAIKQLFDKPNPNWQQDFFTSDRSPVFILGMPRSGTTLLEQILGAHSSIGNSGESRGMGIAFQRCLTAKSILPEDQSSKLPFMRYKTLDFEDSKSIINYYDHYQSLLSDKPVVTDKELSNIDRVGLIKKLYPKAKFICIRRHPLDVCVSIMQHDFSGAYFSASSLKIAQEYEAYYDRATHWHKLYPDSVLIIQYEELVADFETQSRELIKFLGLAWEDAIKQFHKRENSVRTPSLSQVRSAINTQSLEKWRKYGPLIRPAEEYLAAR